MWQSSFDISYEWKNSWEIPCLIYYRLFGKKWEFTPKILIYLHLESQQNNFIHRVHHTKQENINLPRRNILLYIISLFSLKNSCAAAPIKFQKSLVTGHLCTQSINCSYNKWISVKKSFGKWHAWTVCNKAWAVFKVCKYIKIHLPCTIFHSPDAWVDKMGNP